MIPVKYPPRELPRKIPKGVKLIYQETPSGGFTTGRNPYKKNTADWVAFERLREANWVPWVWQFSSWKAFITFQAMKVKGEA